MSRLKSRRRPGRPVVMGYDDPETLDRIRDELERRIQEIHAIIQAKEASERRAPILLPLGEVGRERSDAGR